MGEISLMAPTHPEGEAYFYANDNNVRLKLIPRNGIRNRGIVNNLGHQEGKTV